MKIKQLFLSDHIRLRFSNIREIEINTADSDTHLIIGSNGSGKSSILHEFIPYPPTKAFFGPDGFKSLTLDHDNKEYVLTYDVRHGHQFVCEGINLNISGTNEIQKDLIREHFGITSEIHTLLKCALPICSMLPSQRKKLLMSINPVDVSLFNEKYKKVHRDVVAYGNNLDMLYDRQKQLMMQRLPEEQYNSMIEHKAILENQERILLVWMTTVSSERDRYQYAEIDWEPTRTKQSIANLYKVLVQFTMVSRKEYSNDIIRYTTKQEIIASEISTIERTLSTLIEELNVYESQKKIMSDDQGDVSKELADIIQRLNFFNFPIEFIPITESQLSVVKSIMTGIVTNCVAISYIPYTEIKSKAELELINRNMFNLDADIRNTDKTIQQVSTQRAELMQSIRTYSTGKNCNTSQCELLQVYSDSIKSKQSKLDMMSEQIDNLNKQSEELRNSYNSLQQVYSNQEIIWNHIDKILELVHSNETLSRQYPDHIVLDFIRTDVTLFGSRIEEYISQSESFGEFKKLQEYAKALEEKNSSFESKKQLSIMVLDKDILTHSETIQKLRIRHKELSDERHINAFQIYHLQRFDQLKDYVRSIEEDYDRALAQAESNASYEYFNKLYSVMNTILQSIRSELIDLTRICKEQELLLVRLDTEIDSVIKVIKPKYDEAKHVETALFELPIIYTKKFINDIIDTTNSLIHDIMTYRVELLHINDDIDFGFSFPVIIGDIPLKDISECSEGQKAIIQLAFNLAVIIELNLNNLPVFCDEVDRALDVVHAERLTDTLLNLISGNIINQLFVIGHDKSFLAAFQDSENVIMLNGDNIDLPNSYNTNVKITYN